MGISSGRLVWTVLETRWIMLGIPWVCQGQAPWARLVLVQFWVLQSLFLGDDAGPTRVGRGLSQTGGYWGGTLEAKVVVVLCGLLATLGQDVVWSLVGVWVI